MSAWGFFAADPHVEPATVSTFPVACWSVAEIPLKRGYLGERANLK